jgi:hypothetical protein
MRTQVALASLSRNETQPHLYGSAEPSPCPQHSQVDAEGLVVAPSTWFDTCPGRAASQNFLASAASLEVLLSRRMYGPQFGPDQTFAAASGGRPRIRSAARSASIMTMAFMCAEGISGRADASTTRSPSTARTLRPARQPAAGLEWGRAEHELEIRHVQARFGFQERDQAERQRGRRPVAQQLRPRHCERDPVHPHLAMERARFIPVPA